MGGIALNNGPPAVWNPGLVPGRPGNAPALLRLPPLQALLMALEDEGGRQPLMALLGHLVKAGELTTSQTSKVGTWIM